MATCILDRSGSALLVLRRHDRREQQHGHRVGPRVRGPEHVRGAQGNGSRRPEVPEQQHAEVRGEHEVARAGNMPACGEFMLALFVRFRQEGVRAAHGEGVLPRSKRPALRGGPHMHALRDRAARKQPRPGEAASLQSSVLKAEAQNSKRSQADGKSVKAGMRLSSRVFCWRWFSCKFYRIKAADPRRAASTTSPSRSGGRLHAPCFTQDVNRGSRIAK